MRDINSNIWKLYVIRFFHSLVPAYVIERLFWEQRGMSIQEVVYTFSILAHALIGRFRYRPLLAGVLAVMATCFFYAALVRDVSGLAALCLIFVAAGIVEPLASGYLHRRIDSSMRATMDSFQSLGLNAVSILSGLGFGYFSSRLDIFGGFGFLAVLCGLFLMFFLRMSRFKITE